MIYYRKVDDNIEKVIMDQESMMIEHSDHFNFMLSS